LESLANKLYNNKNKNNKINLDYKKFAKLLYGDIYYDEKNNKFTKDMTGDDKKRTFVNLFLNLYTKLLDILYLKKKKN
jgi:hypothetical protein